MNTATMFDIVSRARKFVAATKHPDWLHLDALFGVSPFAMVADVGLGARGHGGRSFTVVFDAAPGRITVIDDLGAPHVFHVIGPHAEHNVVTCCDVCGNDPAEQRRVGDADESPILCDACYLDAVQAEVEKAERAAGWDPNP